MSRSLVALLVLLSSRLAHAGVTHEGHAWQGAFLDGPIHGRLRWYVDLHARFNEGGPWTQILRPALQIDLAKDAAIYLGYAWVWSQRPEGTRLELRPWQQLFVHHWAGPARLSHRFRIEERLLPDGDFAWRFRYFLRAAAPVRGRIWMGTMQELFLRFESPVFDQHRAFFGPSITWKGGRLDIGYQLLGLDRPDTLLLGHTFAMYVFHAF